jgi:hypothetical protein
MSTARQHPAPGTRHNQARSITLLAITTTALTALLTACSGTSSTLPPAPTTTSATSANPSASLDAEKAKVIAAYHAYEQALMKLLAGGKADPKIMEGTETPEGALEDARQAGVMFSTGDRMVGTLTSTPRSVQITGDTATLITCVDSTKWVSVKAGATPTPGQTGMPRGLAKAQFIRDAQGNWLLKDSAEAGPC